MFVPPCVCVSSCCPLGHRSTRRAHTWLDTMTLSAVGNENNESVVGSCVASLCRGVCVLVCMRMSLAGSRGQCAVRTPAPYATRKENGAPHKRIGFGGKGSAAPRPLVLLLQCHTGRHITPFHDHCRFFYYCLSLSLSHRCRSFLVLSAAVFRFVYGTTHTHTPAISSPRSVFNPLSIPSPTRSRFLSHVLAEVRAYAKAWPVL